MVIDELNPGAGIPPLANVAFGSNNPEINRNDKFTDSLKELIADVNTMQKNSAQMTDKFIKGEPVDLHDVMIAAEKAKTSFELLMQLRNKFTDMYQEINRMQI